MKTSPNDISNQEILEAVQGIADGQRRLEESQMGLGDRVGALESFQEQILEAVQAFSEQVDGRLSSIEQDVGSLKSDVGSLKSDMIKVKATMVTKDYLDEKLAIHHSDMVLRMQKEDRKTLELARKP